MKLDADLHHAAEAGDTARLIRLAQTHGTDSVNAFDEAGRTPLMIATTSAHAGIETLRALINLGAHLDTESRCPVDVGMSALAFALSAGDIAKVRLLLEAGADLHYSRAGYSALIDAACPMRRRRSDEDIALIRLLIQAGARLDDITPYAESGLSVLSDAGRFDLVRCLLDAGADPAPLVWTPLHQAVALGTLADVNSAVDAGLNLEAKDAWERTAFLLAIQTGDQHKVELLLLSGVDSEARGRCGKPPLFYAIESEDESMLSWLLSEGISPLQLDSFGRSALAHASEHSNFLAVRTLLEAGLDPDQHDDHRNALYCCEDPRLAKALIDAGADPQHLQFELRRALVGLPSQPSSRLFDATREDYQHGAHRRFGDHNGERINDPFWRAMVTSGIDGYSAKRRFASSQTTAMGPVWCAQRFGQSITLLPDGRVIQVGGEHEDWYDPDFCIYNDVFVHHADGRFDIHGYPESVFPPTDFHTATLAGDVIYLIGSLGYQDHRTPGTTPVYVLDTSTLAITRVQTTGEAPGWISRHRALLAPDGTIRVFGGRVDPGEHGSEQIRNNSLYSLDLRHHVWRRREDI